MYKVKCTGKNKNYGEKDEIRLIADTHLNVGLRNGWFELISFEGTLKPYTPYFLKQSIKSISTNIKALELKKRMYEDILRKLK